MDREEWRHESKHAILEASPALRWRFRESMRTKLKEENGEDYVVNEEELEELAASAWHIRAKEVCERADVLLEEGVPDEEVRNILRVEPE